jgi:hypothetical protein
MPEDFDPPLFEKGSGEGMKAGFIPKRPPPVVE